MITINTERGLIDVSSWNDILERPAFRVGIDPADHELKTIIGRYVFGDKVQCGLSNCRTPHAKGYVVITKDGLETNIGKDCGSRYFGIDFEEQARQFENDLAAKENREILWNFFFRTEKLEKRISVLRDEKKGANWVHKHCNSLLNPAKVSVFIPRKLHDLSKQKSNLLTIPREASQQEFDRMTESAGHKLKWPQYVDEHVAVIDGIEALYHENDLRKILVIEVIENLKLFKNQKIDELNNDKLKRWKKWVNSVENILEQSEFIVSKGRILLSKKNLLPLLKLPGMEDEPNRTLFLTFLDSLEL